MKNLILTSFIFFSTLAFGQNSTNWTEYDTLIDANGKVSLKVSAFRDSAFFSSFKTTIADTTVEIKKAGFLWTKKYRIETHVFGPKWDYLYGENPNNTRICTKPYGISFITRLEKK